jgi:uncharacterized membrane protein
MFGRNGRGQVLIDAAGEATTYGGEVLKDKKARRRLAAAATAGVAARRRAKRQTGAAGLLRRLAEDPVFRAQVVTMVVSLQQVWQRVERRRSHKLRNLMLVLGGAGAATAVVAVPTVRARVLGLVGGTTDRLGSVAAGSSPTTITEEVEVGAPLSSVYNQWTQFEDFPAFMEGVETVEQLDDTRLRWVAKVAGKRAEWEAKILHQDPDQRIGWQSTDGKQTMGVVTFDSIGGDRTRIRLTMTYVPEGPLERAGSAVGLDTRRIRGDLQRFKELIEGRGSESGAWRGEIKAGRKTSASEAM